MMRWPQVVGFGRAWDPFREFDRLHSEIDRVFSPVNDSYGPSFPALDVWANEESAVVTAELPGVEPNEIEISVDGDELTVSGKRPAAGLAEGQSYLRRERGFGEFKRTLKLPYRIDASAVDARFSNGVLQITAPRIGADRPRRIEVQAA
jgi:HSP20 family protein